MLILHALIPWLIVCVYVHTHMCTGMCLITLSCPQALIVGWDFDYFCPINALFILAISLWLEWTAADYSVWKEMDSQQQFRLGDKNITMENETGSL